MMDMEDVPPVVRNELLARFVLFKRHIRQGNTLKPDAFIPHPHHDLSVTRHRDSTEQEVLLTGLRVASERDKVFRGRGDLKVSDCLEQDLTVEAEPVPGNPNHANISDGPTGKALQKRIALKLSARSVFVPYR